MQKHLLKLQQEIESLKAQNAMLHTRTEKVDKLLEDNAALSSRLDAMEIIILAKGAIRKRK